jgi:hypothetical protein
MPVFLGTIGLRGRLINVHRELETRLFRVSLSPLCLFASANLLDDERR